MHDPHLGRRDRGRPPLRAARKIVRDHDGLTSEPRHASFTWCRRRVRLQRPGRHAKIKEAAGALDAASEAGSTDWTVDSIGAQGGRVIMVLPQSDQTKTRRADVVVEFTLGYTLLGNVTTFAGTLSYPAMPEDNAAAGAWMENELQPARAARRVGLGEGRQPEAHDQALKAPKLRVLDGGLDRIREGLDIMQKGDHKAEKLVYKLA